MSYEGEYLKDLGMPDRKKVEEALLISLFEHNGVIKEFGEKEKIVGEIADSFRLSDEQRAAYLETVYRKENRVKKSYLWHRLLFRAADSLAKDNFVTRPTKTLKLTKKRAWMLTESGFDAALELLNIPVSEKEYLSTKSYEVQKIVKEISETKRPKDYDPFDARKKIVRVSKESSLRTRSFRHAIIEAYEFRCAVCGLSIYSPDTLSWEVEAAHIVPHSAKGKDDIWNGLALCHLHHWLFDVGWFTILDDYTLKVSPKKDSLPNDFGRMENDDILKSMCSERRISLPKRKGIYPHRNAMNWHRDNIFHK
jgi:HNH endonuclease